MISNIMDRMDICCIWMGKYEEAMEYIERGLVHAPDNYWNYYYLALVSKILGNDEQSDQALIKSVELVMLQC